MAKAAAAIPKRLPPSTAWILVALAYLACYACASGGRAKWAASTHRKKLALHHTLARIRGGLAGEIGKEGFFGERQGMEDAPLEGHPSLARGDEHPPPEGSSVFAGYSRSAPHIPKALPAGPVNPSSRSVPVLRLGRDGQALESAMSRQQLAKELRCPLRDLRVADPTFPGQFPSVLARCGSIIVSVADVKAIIRAGELLLFPTTPEVMSIVPAVQQKMNGGGSGLVNGNVPFEQTALECCLKHVCQKLHDSVRDVEPRLRKVLGSFETDKNSLIKSLYRLLPIKNELDELQETIVTFCKCMNDVLMNDEDMALMYLTEAEQSGGETRDPSQHEEIEMLFENYLLQLELLASDVRDFQNEVRNNEEIVEIELDVLRNNILRFELLLSISGFTVTLGALVTGIFGMNLLSGWEEKPNTFWQVTGAIYGCILFSIAGTVAFCRRLKLL